MGSPSLATMNLFPAISASWTLCLIHPLALTSAGYSSFFSLSLPLLILACLISLSRALSSAQRRATLPRCLADHGVKTTSNSSSSSNRNKVLDSVLSNQRRQVSRQNFSPHMITGHKLTARLWSAPEHRVRSAGATEHRRTIRWRWSEHGVWRACSEHGQHQLQ